MAGKQRPAITFVCDNCDESLKFVEATGLPMVKTNLGNAKSLKYALELSMQHVDEDEHVYFVEDDYLHHPRAWQVLQEGCNLSEYITLYDHPDKYTQFYGFGEVSKVIKTKSSHWRFTQSTCMTFVTKPKYLKEDWSVWEKHISGIHPNDHQIFTDLKEIGRKLVLPMPGMACHTDLAVSGVLNQILIDEWAIELALTHIEKEIHGCESLLQGKTGWDRLKLGAALMQHVSR